MTLLFMLALAAVLTVVPIVASMRLANRIKTGPPSPVRLSPARGADFWAVERCIDTGARSVNPRVRGLVRAEIAFRRGQAATTNRALPGQWWVAMGAGYLTLAAAVQRPEEVVFGIVYLAIGPILGRGQRREREALHRRFDEALAVNAD